VVEIVRIPALSDNYIWLVHEPDSGETMVVDPAEAEPVLAQAAARGWRITQIWNTHWHPDHTGGNAAIKAATGAVVTGPAAEAARIPTLDRQVGEGDRVSLGALEAVVMEVPAHTAGHIAYHFAGEEAAFVGDTLFPMGCGRLFEGTAEQMHANLQRLAGAAAADPRLLRPRIYRVQRPLRAHRRSGQRGAAPACRGGRRGAGGRGGDGADHDRSRARDQPVHSRFIRHGVC
jgi:hydroxyacylglutathione hydrolase